MDTLLIGLVALLGYSEYFLGTSQLQRPLVMGTLTGLVLGDINQGIILGAAIELVFMGVSAIGAAIPPEVTAGGILGTAFAINSGAGVEVALALALPIATIGLLCKNIIYIFIRPILNHRADEYAKKGDSTSVGRMHLISTAVFIVTMTILVSVSYSLGNNVVNSLLQLLPDFITRGFEIAAGLLPAVGFALLLRMMISKTMTQYYILGFALAAYLQIPIMGIAVFGIAIAMMVMSFINSNNNTKEELVDDDF